MFSVYVWGLVSVLSESRDSNEEGEGYEGNDGDHADGKYDHDEDEDDSYDDFILTLMMMWLILMNVYMIWAAVAFTHNIHYTLWIDVLSIGRPTVNKNGRFNKYLYDCVNI